LKDPALEALLKGLAQHNVGLCLVTTRESVADLAPFHATTAPEWLLECLSEEAGAQLLFNMGVKKAGNADIGPGDQELKDATREIGGHALTLQLLGPYLAKAHQGNVRKRELVAFRKADAKVQGGHAFRMLSAYEKWLTGAREEGETQLAILRVLGLFDRPADAGCIAALRKKPPIRGLTERLVDLTEEDWNLTLSNLRECGLITIQRNGPSPVGSRVSLDAHPLVREYFARQMREESPDTWRASHSRLYKYLCDLPEKKSPDTFEEMEPLYAAVQHGSEAGYFKDALRKVFRQRLRRGDEQYSFRCGLAGADLAVLSSFFERHWSHVVPVFSPRDQGYILNEAGSALRTLGRLSEAEEPVRASLSMLKRIRDWKAAANTCTTLVNVLLLGGNMSGALAAAREGVEFADKSKDDYFCVSTRITLARVLHHHGETAEAMQHIRKAKRIAPNMRASSRYALQSASICDVLITRGQLREAEKWTEQALESLARVGGHPRETALHCIRLGRIHLERALKGQSECLSIAASHLRRGVEEMRKANRRDELPAALISLASLLSAEGKLSDARAYLDEAWQIAERGSMRLHMADVLLHRGRLLRDTAALAEARKLIDECGYHRRDEELIDAEEAAKGW
ncbi:MAG: hypothetical protein JW955_07510, partial [Sedimentisphaerales bacterium]|nr:hypothetical protein [Sedimentisphaerales bacterium]